MVIEIPDLNYAAIFISGLLASLLGYIWYHPKVMGQKWADATGKKLSDVKSSPSLYIIMVTLWVISAAFYALIIEFMDVEFEGWYFALSCLLWVAFSLPPAIMSGFYTGRSFEAISIDASYQLAGYYVFAAVHIAFLALG